MPEMGPLNISPCFTQCMTSVIALEVDHCAPFLDHIMQIFCTQSATLADKKIIIVLTASHGKQAVNGINAVFIEI